MTQRLNATLSSLQETHVAKTLGFNSSNYGMSCHLSLSLSCDIFFASRNNAKPQMLLSLDLRRAIRDAFRDAKRKSRSTTHGHSIRIFSSYLLALGLPLLERMLLLVLKLHRPPVYARDSRHKRDARSPSALVVRTLSSSRSHSTIIR